MLIKLQTGLVINPNYITAIAENASPRETQKGFKISYIIYTVDGNKWEITKEDYIQISTYMKKCIGICDVCIHR